jgi:hypothetical protein
MILDRRVFLGFLAGSPLIFGLRELLAQEGAPEFVAAALQRMKKPRKYGVFIVLPGDKESREAIGQGLLDQLADSELGGSPAVRLFCVHVFVCLTEDQAKQAGFGAKAEGEGILRLLVNSEGKLIHADRVKLEVFKDKAGFASSFSEFVHGKEMDRLRDQAKAIQESITEDVRQAAARLNDEDVRKTLPAAADTIAPWLSYKSYFAKDHGERLLTVLRVHYRKQLDEGPLLALPFGIKTERVTGSDPCPPCGMSGPYKTYSFRFLSFYTK